MSKQKAYLSVFICHLPNTSQEQRGRSTLSPQHLQESLELILRFLAHSPIRECLLITDNNGDVLLLPSEKWYFDLLRSYCGHICHGTLYLHTFVHISFDSLMYFCLNVVCMWIVAYQCNQIRLEFVKWFLRFQICQLYI